jgi:hypothetical protein
VSVAGQVSQPTTMLVLVKAEDERLGQLGTMSTVAYRIILAIGLVLLVGGIAGVVLPVLPGWALISLAVPLLVIAAVLRLTTAAKSRASGKSS